MSLTVLYMLHLVTTRIALARCAILARNTGFVVKNIVISVAATRNSGDPCC